MQRGDWVELCTKVGLGFRFCAWVDWVTAVCIGVANCIVTEGKLWSTEVEDSVDAENNKMALKQRIKTGQEPN